jgi:5-methylcytosine-specific restriction endonuclease McrA
MGIHTSSDAFLMTYEWRKVRMEALKKYGARCQCCGATPAHGAVMNVDHIKPRKLFPHLALDLNNLQVLCHDCNHGKGNWDMTDWRERNESPIQLDLRDVSIKVF